jgi:hypothetical protein
VDRSDLAQAVAQVARAAERLMEWRWSSAEETEKVASGERPLSQATASEPPTDNETVLQLEQTVEGQTEWRWISPQAMKEVAMGERPSIRVLPPQPPISNETIEETLHLYRALSESVAEIHQTASTEEETHADGDNS